MTMVQKPIPRYLSPAAGLLFAGLAAAAIEIDDFASAAAAYQRGDYAEAWRIWLPLAREGDVDAQFSLGMLCDRAPPIAECDAGVAMAWYARAAEAGHRLAQFSLGTAFSQGRGVQRDEAKARYWLGKAAAQGLPAARDVLPPEQGTGLGPARGGADDVIADRAEDLAEPTEPTQTTEHAAPAVPAAPAARTAPAAAVVAAAPALPAAPHAPPAERESVATQPVARATADAQWLAERDPAHYSAQLAASPDADGLRAFAARNALGEAARVLCASDTCDLVFGAYATRDEAWAAIRALPEPVRARKPWPRAFSYYRSRVL